MLMIWFAACRSKRLSYLLMMQVRPVYQCFNTRLCFYCLFPILLNFVADCRIFFGFAARYFCVIYIMTLFSSVYILIFVAASGSAGSTAAKPAPKKKNRGVSRQAWCGRWCSCCIIFQFYWICGDNTQENTPEVVTKALTQTTPYHSARARHNARLQHSWHSRERRFLSGKCQCGC